MKTKTLIIGSFLAIFALFSLAVLYVTPLISFGSEFPKQSLNTKNHASTTVYALSPGVQTRLVATSTYADATATLPVTVGRTAVALQTINCGATGHVWLQFNDVLAATSTGYFLAASSTIVFADQLPIVNGSIRAISVSASCSVLVTEFRSEN